MTAPSRETLDVLYVGTLPPQPGGAAIVGATLLERLAARGHSVRALAPITARARAGGELTGGLAGVQVTWFLVPRFDSAPDVPPDDDLDRSEHDQITSTLAAMIRERRPDAVVIGRESFARHVPGVARDCRVPTLMLVHGDPTRGLIAGTYPAPHAGRLLARYHQLDHIATPGRHMAAGLERLGLRRVTVIPNGIDLDHFTPRPKDSSLLRALKLPGQAHVLLHASKLEKGKRAHDLAASAEQVLALGHDVVYVIVGDGPERGPLENTCRRKGLADRFRFVGWVEHRDMPRYMNLADAVLMPSDAETQALVYLETQACGRLLVASDIPAAREVVVDGETGILFRTGDVDDLAAKTLRAMDDALLRERIGRAARAQARHHALEDMATRYEDLLRSVAAGRRELAARQNISR